MSPGDRVYKITDKGLMRRARASFEGKSVSLKVEDEEGNSITKELPEGAEKAVNRPVTVEAVIAQLSKTGGTPFRVLETFHRRGNRKPVSINWSLPAKRSVPKTEEETCLYLYRADKDEQFSKVYSRIYVPYVAVLKGFFQGDDRIIPVIPNITKGWHDHNIRENFDKLVEVSAQKGIALGNLGWIEPFVNAEVNVFGDYGLNLYNSADFQLARELGIKEAFVSHEADLEDILAMDFHGVVPEVAISGKIPVMTSEHCVASDLNFCGKKCEQTNIFLKDRKGQLYPIITNPDDCRSVILSHKETNLLMQKEALKNAGICRFRIYAE